MLKNNKRSWFKNAELFEPEKPKYILEDLIDMKKWVIEAWRKVD